MMTASECVRKHLWIATELDTVYMYAAYAFLVTDATINSKLNQDLNNWYTKNNMANTKKLRALVGKGYIGFDCVNLTKSVLWGFSNDRSRPYGCGATFKSNGVPDRSANELFKLCYDQSDDFKDIIPGEGLWMSGHWGLYVGDGLAVECTNWSYCDGVQITAVANIGKKSGFRSRTWTKHGKLPWLDYSENGTVFIPMRYGMKGDNVAKMQEMLIALNFNLNRYGADGDFGAETQNALYAFQDEKGLEMTGVCDEKTYELLKIAYAQAVEKPVNNVVPLNPEESHEVKLVRLTKLDAQYLKAFYGDKCVILK